MKITVNTSIRHQVIIAAIISIWLVVFLVIIAPFDVADLSFMIRLQLMPLYGLISFVGYLIVLPIQNWYFSRWKRWGWPEEIGFITLLNIIVFIGSYEYYQSDMINGDYSFGKFALEVYSPIFVILLFTIVLLRLYIFKSKEINSPAKILLQGENKYDLLQLELSDLISISSADNYVEVAYLKNQQLQKKLLRTTLKAMATQVPELVKVHRSHLVNPEHIVAWKDANRLILTQSELPVSKQFKKSITDWINRP